MAQEIGVWSRYLAGLSPSPKVVARYIDAHGQNVVSPEEVSGAFDSALLRIARGGPFLARACDVHARVFRPGGVLRRKLVLALALLETDRHSHGRVDAVGGDSRLGLVVAIAGWGLRFLLLFTLGLLFFVPLRAICALFPTSRSAP